MNRFKSVIIIVCAALGFASCETEVLDDHTKGTEGAFKPVFSFSLNGERRTTEDVYVNWVNSNSFEIVANIRDEYSAYNLVEAKIRFSALMKGAFPTFANVQATDLTSSAQLKLPGVPVYSTQNAPLNVYDTGVAAIKDINYVSEYMHGTFEYALYPPRPADPDELQMPPIFVKDGKFHYLGYK